MDSSGLTVTGTLCCFAVLPSHILKRVDGIPLLSYVIASCEGACMFEIPNKSKSEKLAQLTTEQKDQIQTITDDAIANFKGDLIQLESAIGMLHMGQHFGWKVLYIIHSKRTIRNYENILSIKIRDIFPETGPSSYRSAGYQAAEKLSNFWKVVSGELKIDNKREVD